MSLKGDDLVAELIVTSDMTPSADGRLLTVADIQNIFGIGRSVAYKLMNADGFPLIRLNKFLRVSPQALEKWINQQAGHAFYF